MTTIQRYLIGRLFVTSSIIVFAFCVPISAVALLKDVPTSLMYSKLIWPILYGIIPTAVYLTLPAAVAIGCMYWYSTLISDSVIAVLYAAGYSQRAVIMPAFVVSVVAALICGFISCVVVPHGTTQLYDILHSYAHNMRPTYLEAEQFYRFDDGRRVLYFQRWAGPYEIEGVFLRELKEKREEIVVTAPTGRFIELEQEAILVLYNGVIETFSLGDAESTTTKFDTLTRQTGLNGTEFPKRNWVGMFELGPLEFPAAFNKVKDDRLELIHWTSEALKRFGAPVLAIAHTLLGVGLVMRSGAVRRRQDWWRHQAIYGVPLLLHMSIMLAAEGALAVDIGIAWIIVVAIVLELIVGILLVTTDVFSRRRETSTDLPHDDAVGFEALALQRVRGALPSEPAGTYPAVLPSNPTRFATMEEQVFGQHPAYGFRRRRPPLKSLLLG